MTSEPGAGQAAPQLLFATSNAGKLREGRALLASLPLQVVSLASLGLAGEVEEDGADYAANATKKAVHWALASGLPCLGEDSGLEVAALGGRPGVRSARYGGPEVSDAGRNRQEDLAELKGAARQSALPAFVSLLVLVSPKGEALLQAHGECVGRISGDVRGAAGFGYDPIFEPAGSDQTFAQIGEAAKSAQSHRGRAFRRLVAELQPHRDGLEAFLRGRG